MDTTSQPPSDATPTADLAPEPSGVRGRLRGALGPSLAVAGTLGALEFLRGRFQHAQTFLPERFPDGLWQPQNYGLPAEDVWFRSEDGERLHGWWVPHPLSRGTVLFCHGNAGNITHRIAAYRFLRRTGLNVLTFDYRGYGRSSGRPSEKGVLLDARAAHRYLVNELGEDPQRVVLFGHSLGGAIAIDTALDREVAGLVAQSTFLDLGEMARDRFPKLPLHLVARTRLKSSQKVPLIDVPKLFIHGTADETIPHHHGERLFDAASDPKEWYSISGAGHNDVHRQGGWRYLWKLVRFSRTALGDARRRAKVDSEASPVASAP